MPEGAQLDEVLVRLQKHKISAKVNLSLTILGCQQSALTRRQDGPVAHYQKLPRELRQKTLYYACGHGNLDTSPYRADIYTGPASHLKTNPYTDWFESRHLFQRDITELSKIHATVSQDMEFVGN